MAKAPTPRPDRSDDGKFAPKGSAGLRSGNAPQNKVPKTEATRLGAIASAAQKHGN